MKETLLYIGNDLNRGKNNPTYMSGLSVALRNAGYYVKTASGKPAKLARLWHMCATVYSLRKKASFVLIDTYSTQNFYYALIVSFLCRLLKLKYIPILHGGNLPKRMVHSPWMSKQLFNNAFVNVSPSKYLAIAMESCNFTNVICIPNAIEIDQFDFTFRSNLRPLKIFWMRAFKDIYNPLLAVKTFEQLKKTFPDAQLTMAGPEADDTLEQCKVYAEEHQLDIQFLGKLSRKEWALESKNHNLYLNTSRADNAPLTFLEAMALGLPVVSTDVGGIGHLIARDDTGILVSKQEPEALARAIEKLRMDPAKVQELSEAGREQALEHDWEPIIEDWVRVMS